MKESELKNRIRLTLGRMDDVAIWNNPVGYDPVGRIRYGLMPGSADLVGVACGTFLALEVKTVRGRVSALQRDWLDRVRELGGVAKVVRSVEEAVEAVEECRRRHRRRCCEAKRSETETGRERHDALTSRCKAAGR